MKLEEFELTPIPLEDPDGWRSKRKARKQRSTYGVSEFDATALDMTILQWLYNALVVHYSMAEDIVDDSELLGKIKEIIRELLEIIVKYECNPISMKPRIKEVFNKLADIFERLWI